MEGFFLFLAGHSASVPNYPAQSQRNASHDQIYLNFFATLQPQEDRKNDENPISRVI